MLDGFKKFILKGNVVDLAVGVVIGISFGAVVTALVKDVITPFIGAFGGQPDFSALQFTINHSKFLIGDFLNALISFLINAAVIYLFVILPLNRFSQKPAKSTTKICPECLSVIPLRARRCSFCTSRLNPIK
ncbi:MAG: large conductance mechanosensitive channel protein MscL [Candidatus Shapirobacteria bacterium]|nr:large conductance mechanosensitive channel protein MscL [Candidatus Shapirobacteria bacterium]